MTIKAAEAIYPDESGPTATGIFRFVPLSPVIFDHVGPTVLDVFMEVTELSAIGGAIYGLHLRLHEALLTLYGGLCRHAARETAEMYTYVLLNVTGPDFLRRRRRRRRPPSTFVTGSAFAPATTEQTGTVAVTA